MQINFKRSFFISIAVFVSLLFFDVYFLSALGLGFTIFVFVDFIEKLGKTTPILEVLLLIACLQWILGPYIDYITDYKHYKYYMYVSEEVYMNLVVPSMLIFAIPVYLISNRINYDFLIKQIRELNLSNQFAAYLIIGGFISDLLGRFAPASIGFVFFLASGIKYVGLLYLFFNNSSVRWIAFFILFTMQFLVAVRGGLFHYLLLWGVFMMIFISLFLYQTFTKKLVLIILGFLFVFIIQTIKNEYRNSIWGNYNGNETELFLSLFFNRVEDYFIGRGDGLNVIKNKDKEDEVTNRLNQGWIISRIMSRIPARKPFLNGETIETAIYSSIVPRILSDSKASGGGGRLTYEKLTGFELKSASMGTGILAESYGNYGVIGTYIFMFFWGLFLALFYRFIYQKSMLIKSLPLWLPIIFFQVIKAETDLFTVLNHLVKSTIFVFGFIYIARHVFKVRF